MKVIYKTRYVEEIFIESSDLKEIKIKREELRGEEFNVTDIRVGCKNGDEESRIYYFDAIKKIDIRNDIDLMKKIICVKCNKQENKKASMDSICVTCWNKK